MRTSAGGSSWRARGMVGVVLGSVALLTAACTSDPVPTPTPTPTSEQTTEPAPSGVDVGVILPPRSDPSAALFLDVEEHLDDLAEELVGDVAAIRSVVPDDAQFVPDLAALWADEGDELVCILGSDGARTALTLADRFPATRFCALAEPRDSLPPNVELFEVAHEELGHALGTAVSAATGGGPVGLVVGDESEDRARRRAGARAALADVDVPVDAIVRDVTEATELAETAAGEDGPDLAAVIVDVGAGDVIEAVAAAAPVWVGPGGASADDAPGTALLRWSLRAEVIVAAAVERLVSSEVEEEPTSLGFEEELFRLTFADGTADPVRAATERVVEELARGERDPLEVRPVSPRGAPEEGGEAPEAEGEAPEAEGEASEEEAEAVEEEPS